MSKNKDLAQLEEALKELRAGQEEVATTAALGSRRGNLTFSGTLFKLFFKYWGVRILLVVMLLVLVILGSLWLFSGSTFSKESTTFVEQVQDLSTLATAEAHLKVIIEQKDNKLFGREITYNLPGTKRELLLVVPATVIAGVDLKGITSEDMQLNEKDKELDIILPRASFIQDPALQMDQIRTFSDEGLLRGEIKWEEGFDLAAEAQDQIKAEAIEIGLLQRAEESAEKVLKEFFRNLGYSVNVSFK